VRGEVIRQRGELGGVAPEAFHLVDGEDDPAVRGVGFDLAACLQGGFEPWPFTTAPVPEPDAGIRNMRLANQTSPVPPPTLRTDLVCCESVELCTRWLANSSQRKPGTASL
jgi:hypothetical protein